MDIGPFAGFIAERVRWSMRQAISADAAGCSPGKRRSTRMGLESEMSG
jgi:hypothetical protein